jgi:hypothetical protein
MVDNVRVEGCIAEEFKLKEITYFTSVYFIEHHNVNRPNLLKIVCPVIISFHPNDDVDLKLLL